MLPDNCGSSCHPQFDNWLTTAGNTSSQSCRAVLVTVKSACASRKFPVWYLKTLTSHHATPYYPLLLKYHHLNQRLVHHLFNSPKILRILINQDAVSAFKGKSTKCLLHAFTRFTRWIISFDSIQIVWAKRTTRPISRIRMDMIVAFLYTATSPPAHNHSPRA